jgi:acyl-CoA synthetase (NDP forming)
MLAADDVDALIVIYTTIDSSCTNDILSAIAAGVVADRTRGGAKKPVLVCTMATPDMPPLGAGAETLPVYEFPERAARALGKAAAYAEWRAASPGAYVSVGNMRVREARDLCRGIVQARGETWLTPDELHQLLQEADLRLAPGVMAHSADEAAALARVFGFPVVAKMVATQAVHKTELGGVKLHLSSEQAVRAAYGELTERARTTIGPLDGVLIQPMLTGGAEILIGLSHDPVFGPLVAFGLGGIHVELFRDVAFRIAPLTDRDADEMIRSIRGFALLEGYRNQPPVDLRAIRDVLLKISYLGSEIPELVELEFNPVIALATGRGCQIVDVRARVAPAASRR